MPLELAPLMDPFQRTFPYLRLSITDACNFRCQYCLPNGYQKTPAGFLEPSEIVRLVRAFVELGTIKVRLTGGEPTLRKDLPEIARCLKAIPGLQTLAMTTNGYSLKRNASCYYDLGITSLNVSVDSLNRNKFHEMTGHDKLQDVLKGIELAQKIGIKTIKINTVLLKGFNDNTTDLAEFLSWIKTEDLSIRFIELMQTGDNHDYFVKNHVSASIIQEQLLKHSFSLNTRKFDAGPAVEFSHPDYQGKVGLIAPYSKDFCQTCNRLRVTARGDLRLCLFGSLGFPLREYLAHDDQKPLLQARLRDLLRHKKETHALHLGETGLTPHLASLGG
ncbi:MAG: GTP 3',8-cyclase MoaA [Legionellales bacterium]|nr:GTP 3',8-cyclase MoaA [Legionellales bacterium]